LLNRPEKLGLLNLMLAKNGQEYRCMKLTIVTANQEKLDTMDGTVMIKLITLNKKF
jgi:hypothetical protein